jgi:hypothetical protein
MADAISPALTPEEWAILVHFAPADASHFDAVVSVEGDAVRVSVNVNESVEFVGRSRHALAALALHGMPSGFTREDVTELLGAAQEFEAFARIPGVNPMAVESCLRFARSMKARAAKIAALLPPADG